MNAPYLISLFVHILAAITFVGGMLFLSMVLTPVLRRSEMGAVAGDAMAAAAAKFGRIGAASVVLLIVTGFTNAIFKGFGMGVFSGDFWSAPYAHVMGSKLLIAIIIAGIGMVHIGKRGKDALNAMKDVPEDEATLALRRRSSATGRISLILSLIAVLLGIMMSRGFLP